MEERLARAMSQGMADSLNRMRFGSDNDNRPADHPHSLMREAEARFSRSKSLSAGVKHLLKCARSLDKPGWYTQRVAVDIIEQCNELLAALKAGADVETIARHSLMLGTAWGQLRTRASV